mmetsp:Transcript_11593/g.28107  ORF Transcript_11593/g.28107 Transcript_11593/m.28107 type:complete len:216 (-) Transcript_11593:270-917(-)
MQQDVLRRHLEHHLVHLERAWVGQQQRPCLVHCIRVVVPGGNQVPPEGRLGVEGAGVKVRGGGDNDTCDPRSREPLDDVLTHHGPHHLVRIGRVSVAEAARLASGGRVQEAVLGVDKGPAQDENVYLAVTCVLQKVIEGAVGEVGGRSEGPSSRKDREGAATKVSICLVEESDLARWRPCHRQGRVRVHRGHFDALPGSIVPLHDDDLTGEHCKV